MIYLDYTTAPQPLFVPKSRRETSGELRLTLKGTVGLETVVDAEAIDLETSALYYRIAVVLPSDIATGEYEYTLADGDGTLSSGVAVIRATVDAKQYDTSISYEQYESN